MNQTAFEIFTQHLHRRNKIMDCKAYFLELHTRHSIVWTSATICFKNFKPLEIAVEFGNLTWSLLTLIAHCTKHKTLHAHLDFVGINKILFAIDLYMYGSHSICSSHFFPLLFFLRLPFSVTQLVDLIIWRGKKTTSLNNNTKWVF